MAHTKVYFTSTDKSVLSQLNSLTPGESGQWGTLQRVYDVSQADYVAVLEDAEFDLRDTVGNLNKVIGFPLDLKPTKNYLRYNFPHRITWGNGWRVLCSLQGVDKSYDELLVMKCPAKEKWLSCVVTKTTPKSALGWLRQLAATCSFDVFGEDHFIGGKSQYCGLYQSKAFEDYQYSIVLEDTQMEGYFTEKITDCILLWCLPLYWGCPNIWDIFYQRVGQKLSLTGLEGCESREFVKSLEEDPKSKSWEKERWLLDAARQYLLTRLNIWAQVEEISVKDGHIATPDRKMDPRDKGKEHVESQEEKVFDNPNVAKDGICLIMIVRDESHVIERCLKSVVNVISSYCICDTGSLDNTPEIIENFMEAHGVPGQVIHKEWKNFGHNKSYLIRRAYEDNLALGAKYLIWLDADEVFQNQNKENLTLADKKRLLDFANSKPGAGVFMVMTLYGSLEYQRWNMVRNNQLYEWRCPVHEYLHPTKPTGTVYINFFTLWARKEGARTRAGDSGEKDIRMFKEYLKDNPKCSRSTFYLAQTLGEAGKLEEAIEMYQKRIGMPGFYQEAYIAAKRMGQHYLTLKQPETALEVWGKHLGIVKHRLEIPYLHMMLLSKLKRKPEAYKVGLRAYENHKFDNRDLFVEKGVYDWRFYLEFSVIAHYTQHNQLALELGEKLLSQGKYPDSNAKVIENNMKFFRKALGQEKSVPKNISRRFNTHPPGIIVIDDFLPNPNEVRDFALSQEFTVTGNYPGRRTKPFATLDHKEAFERILNTKITYWPDQYNGSFQYTFGSHKSWIHRDATDYSALIYLTPNPPPNGGTLVYRHKKYQIERDSEATKDQLKEMNDDSSNESKWDVMDIVGNKYNRLIIFTGRRSHKSNKYFGSSRESARLFQCFFFNAAGYR